MKIIIMDYCLPYQKNTFGPNFFWFSCMGQKVPFWQFFRTADMALHYKNFHKLLLALSNYLFEWIKGIISKSVHTISKILFILGSYKSLACLECISRNGTIHFWKWKMWKLSYSFRIMAIFYFIIWIIIAETIEGGKLLKWGNYSVCKFWNRSSRIF